MAYQSEPNNSSARTIAELPTIIANTPSIELVRSRFNYAKTALSTRRETWRDQRNAYHGYVSKSRMKKGRSNIWYHKVFPIVELETARQLVHYMQHKPFVTVLPTSGNNSDGAKNHELAVQHYIEHAPTFFLELLRSLKYTSIYGTAFRLSSWRTKTRAGKKYVPVMFHGMEVGTQQEDFIETVYDGLFFKTYSPYDLFPHPLATHISNAPWVISVDFVRADKLMEDAKLGIYDKGAVDKVPLNGYLQDEWEVLRQQQELGYDGPTSDGQMICLQTYMAEDRFITVANNAQVIKESGNRKGTIPMAQCVKSLDPDSFWPIGTVKPILPSQKMVNMFTRAIADSTTSTIWPVWKHKSTVNPATLMSLPNHKISVRQMDDVDIIKMPELKHDLLATKFMFEQNMNETHGYYDIQQGNDQGPVRTATSDNIRQAEGGIRIQGDAMIQEELGLIPDAKNISALVQDFMPEEVEIRIVGAGGDSQFQSITQAEIQGEFTFKASGTTNAINRAVAQKHMIDMFSIANNATQYVKMADGQVIPVPVLDTYEALKDIYQDYNRADVDKLLYRPEVFGIPINNNVLAEYGLPPIPGLDANPMTGALSNTGSAGALNGQSTGRNPKRLSDNPVAITQRANEIGQVGQTRQAV